MPNYRCSFSDERASTCTRGVHCVQVRVGICIWLAKFLRMSRPDQAVRKTEPAGLSGRLSSLTPTSCASARRQTMSASRSSRKSSSKSTELFQRQSSRSLLANVLDLEDNFLLLNLSRRAAQRGRMTIQTSGMSFWIQFFNLF